MAKLLLLRPKNLCVCLTLLALVTLILIFQYQNGSQTPLRARAPPSVQRLPAENLGGRLQSAGMEKAVPANGATRTAKENDKGLWFFQRGKEGYSDVVEKFKTCSTQLEKRSVDIDTGDVFASKLDFENIDSIYWDTHWEDRWNKRKANVNKTAPLRVIVLPHSHNDPGWLQTFDVYFAQQTSHILDNSLNFLSDHRDFRFVWSEISFFARWWATLDQYPHKKLKVIELLSRGQLELLTGGWVMTDEAGVHLYSMLDQLIEGHQWIKHHLGDAALPDNGWSVDPFGHGNAVPYLLRRSGIHNTFIQRTHYAWKRWLANRQQLEFLWETSFRQSGSRFNQKENKDKIMCHMAPFDLYSIKHTCGPDMNVCLQFDFRQLRGERSESRAEPVTSENQHSLAVDLVEQYSKLASLYTHNVALVLLGDDFRYDKRLEWEQQYTNYRTLFTYINDNPKNFNSTYVTFGTLAEYWNEVYNRQTIFPTLSGDFMPYGDVYSEGRPNYWTGYYTTRPFMKQLARELQHYLRAAEILYSLGRHHLLETGHHEQLRSRLDTSYMHLSEARQQLGLFQHHDAVTGTSKLYVMSDYAERLFRGIKGAHSVIAHVMQYLQSVRKPNYQPPPDQTSYDKGYHQDQIPFTTYLQMSEKRISFDTLPIRVGLHLGPSRIDDLAGQTSTKRTAKVVVFNSHASEVQEAIRVHVTGPVQKVVGPNGRELEFQLNPVWGYSAELPTNLYELLFIAELAPLSTTTFEVVRQAVSEKSRTPATRIRLFLSDSWEKDSPEGEKPTLSNGHLFNFETSDDEDIRMTNGNIHVVFNRSTGLLQSVNGRTISMSFGAYRSAEFHSGAYLFRPNPMEPRHNVTGRFPVIRLVRGPLMSELIVVYPDTVMQRARVYHKAPGRAALTAGIELETSFDLSARHDFLEMYMTFESDVASGQEFFTDSAGFEILRRLRNDLLPVEANYYPMTEAVFIQDDSSRLTLLADHAHGVTSSKPGHLEVMLDRKLRFDDSRGLGEGIMDNRHTRSRFWLLMEIRDQNRLDKTISSERQEISLLSRSGHRLATMLNFPPVIMQSLPTGLSRMVHGEIRFLAEPLPCDVHLLNIRTLPEEAGTDATYNHPSLDRALLVLQSRAADCSITVSPNNPLNCGTQKSERGVFFSNVTVTSIQRTTLTGTMPNGEEVSPKNLRVDPHELESFIITFGKSNYNNGVESNNNNHSIHKKMSIPTTTTTQITV